LNKSYQEVIADITKRMGHGMTVFFSRELNTQEDWNEVCVVFTEWCYLLLHEIK